jgi:uncharacterized protein
MTCPVPIVPRLCLAVLVGLGLATPALAFDCAKAQTKVEVAICADPALMDQDRALSAAYDNVKSYSTDAERVMLQLSQRAWIDGRETDCADAVGNDLATCIDEATAARLDVLTARPDAGPGNGSPMIPVFVVQAGGAGLYEIDDTFFRFAKPKTAAEQLFNSAIARLAALAPLGPQKDLMNAENLDSSGQITLSYVSPRLISALYAHGGYDGGAHPNGGTSNINVDFQAGREIAVSDVFTEDAVAKLARQCRDQIIDQKMQNDSAYDPAQDDFLKDEVIAEHIATFSRWTLGETDATVTFDPYAIGPYVEGEYDCTFSMADLKAMALPAAPLP